MVRDGDEEEEEEEEERVSGASRGSGFMDMGLLPGCRLMMRDEDEDEDEERWWMDIEKPDEECEGECSGIMERVLVGSVCTLCNEMVREWE
jgi:hypothetical protein